jgi:hypothetical protein
MHAHAASSPRATVWYIYVVQSNCRPPKLNLSCRARARASQLIGQTAPAAKSARARGPAAGPIQQTPHFRSSCGGPPQEECMAARAHAPASWPIRRSRRYWRQRKDDGLQQRRLSQGPPEVRQPALSHHTYRLRQARRGRVLKASSAHARHETHSAAPSLPEAVPALF